MPSTPPAVLQQVVGVVGTHLTLNGSPWLPRGVAMQALVQPAAAMLASADKNLGSAYNAYNVTELNEVTAFGADTIRFQISQPALDPTSTLYDASYLPEVTAAVRLARQSNFVVLLMMQDEAITGETISHPLATAETQSDWDLLNASFANDQGVLYELYNEPHPAATTANWSLWLNGDPSGTSKAAPGAVGMQTMITHLRSTGSLNVFVLDGLGGAKTLNGVPAVTDPLNALVYAVHPYFDGSTDESQWDTNFGTASLTLPVWADEWSAETGQMIGLYNPPTAVPTNFQISVDFLNYLRTHSIALCGGAFDIPGFIVQSVPNGPYTNYDNFNAAVLGDDAGDLVHALYTTNYGRALTSADGL